MRKKKSQLKFIGGIVLAVVILVAVIAGFYLLNEATVGQALRIRKPTTGPELALISPPKLALVAVHDTAHSSAVMAAPACAW